MNKEEISKFVKDSYKEVFGENYDEAKAEESLKKIFEAAGDDMTKAEASANAIVGKLKAKNEAIQKKQEQFDNLKAIQEELFDAPDEVKANFNKVVQYFAGPKKGNWSVKDLDDENLFRALKDPKATDKDLKDIKDELISRGYKL